MNIKFLLCSFLLATCASAQADWFLRGTQNNWGTTPMVAAGTNTVEVKNVAFTAAGSIKFDRLGDWSQNYGIGGANGSNIPVAAGTWNIQFYTDTKNWKISRVEQYHLRGTHNNWAEGDLFTAVVGSATDYEICRNFGVASPTLSPRFKVDPNGGWGADAFPAQDYSVSGWTKIIVNGSQRKIVSAVSNLGNKCVGPLLFTLPGPITLHIGESVKNSVIGPTDWLFHFTSNSQVANFSDRGVTAYSLGTATITAMEEPTPCIICAARTATYVINVVP